MKILSVFLITFFLTGCSLNSSYVDSGNLFNKKYLGKDTETSLDKPKEQIISTASRKSGVYNETFRLELISNYPKATVFYSTDSSMFDISKFKKYETPILIDGDTLIRFYAVYKDNIENVHQENYKIETIIVKEDPFTEEKNTIEKFIRNMNINEHVIEPNITGGDGSSSTSGDGITEESEN